tara:strand:- start:1655 stop:2356 length:702 start_codon:yes stop_codon:yes gene_type:complete
MNNWIPYIFLLSAFILVIGLFYVNCSIESFIVLKIPEIKLPSGYSEDEYENKLLNNEDIPTPGKCAKSWTSPEDGPGCVNKSGCPSAACNGEGEPWCCNEGSQDCNEWHFCDPLQPYDDEAETPGICAKSWSSAEEGSGCINKSFCPSVPCDGEGPTWCCNEGSKDCDKWHFCNPDLYKKQNNSAEEKNDSDMDMDMDVDVDMGSKNDSNLNSIKRVFSTALTGAQNALMNLK